MTTPDELTRFSYFRGRVALAAILRALGVRSGDEVLLQAFTCVAVPEAIMSFGGRPRYVDVEAGGPNMDSDDLAAKIGPGTKAIVVQHSFGLPADITRLADIARQNGIPLIEDCAHTIASRVDGRQVGSFGVAAFYSYEAAKPVFVGIGGSAISNDEILTQRIGDDYARYEDPPALSQLETAAMFHAYQIAYRPSTYWTVRSLFRTLSAAGVIRGNYNKVTASHEPAGDFTRRMGQMQARRLRRQLATLDAQTAHRRRVAQQYRSLIRSPSVTHPRIPDGVEPVFSRYPLLVENRADVVGRARKARVEMAVFYDTPVHPLVGDALRTVGYEPGSCPNAEWISERIISLPTASQVSDAEVRRAVNFLNATPQILAG